MLDMMSYILGIEKSEGHVVLKEGADYTFEDQNDDGNIVITEGDQVNG